MAGKVQKFFKKLNYTATFADGVLTVVAASNHYLATGDKVTLTDGQGRIVTSLTATVVDATTFSVKGSLDTFVSGEIQIDTYRVGDTGRKILPLGRGTGGNAVVQSFVSGAGGAVYALEASLDGVHWSALATITHAAADGDVQSALVEPKWAFVCANITSVGAATKLEILLGD